MNLICREDCANALEAESAAAKTVAAIKTLHSLLIEVSSRTPPLWRVPRRIAYRLAVVMVVMMVIVTMSMIVAMFRDRVADADAPGRAAAAGPR